MISCGEGHPHVAPETCVAPNSVDYQSTTLMVSAKEVRVERCLVLVEKLGDGVEGIASWIEQTLLALIFVRALHGLLRSR